VLIRGLCEADLRVDRPACCVAVVGRHCVRPCALPRDLLFRDEQPHALLMRLFLLGVSHRPAPVDLRERLDFSSRDLSAAAGAIAPKPWMSEAVVLSTCTRSEMYVATTDPACAREELVSFISEYHHVSAPTVQPHLFALENSAAVAHLFRV